MALGFVRGSLSQVKRLLRGNASGVREVAETEVERPAREVVIEPDMRMTTQIATNSDLGRIHQASDSVVSVSRVNADAEASSDVNGEMSEPVFVEPVFVEPVFVEPVFVEPVFVETDADTPDDPIPMIEAAKRVQDGGDWAAAMRSWAAVRSRFPDAMIAYTSGAAASREAGDLEAAERLLRSAHERFPRERGPVLDLARLMERRGDWTDAERWWRAYLVLDPAPWWAYAALSNALREQGRASEAEAVLEQRLEIFPDDFPLNAEHARVAERERHWPIALDRWSALVDRFPDQWDAYRGAGLALRELGRADEAEGLLRAARERLPREPWVVHDLARLAERRRDWTEAERWWRAYLELDTAPWWAHNGLANALREQDRAAESEAVLESQRKNFPDNFPLNAEHARFAERRQDWPAALDRWSALVDRFPDQWDAYRGAGLALRELGRADEAERLLHAARERLPREPWVVHDLARLAERKRDWTEAEQWWRAYLELDTARWWAHSGLANALREQDRAAESEAVLESQLKNFPDDFPLNAQHARGAERRQDWPTALVRWSALVERFPEQWDAYRGAALALRELDRAEEAEALLLKARAHFPRDLGPLHDLARVAERRRDWPGAEEIWREYLASDSRFAWTHAALGTALLEQGKLDAAEATLLDAQKRFPSDDGLLLCVAEVQRRRGDLRAAARVLDGAADRIQKTNS
jgi:tetratricopeptide (TPR) repeat protein